MAGAVRRRVRSRARTRPRSSVSRHRCLLAPWWGTGRSVVLDPDAEGPGLRDWFEALGQISARAAASDTRFDLPAAITGRASKGIARKLRHHGCRADRLSRELFRHQEESPRARRRGARPRVGCGPRGRDGEPGISEGRARTGMRNSLPRSLLRERARAAVASVGGHAVHTSELDVPATAAITAQEVDVYRFELEHVASVSSHRCLLVPWWGTGRSAGR